MDIIDLSSGFDVFDVAICCGWGEIWKRKGIEWGRDDGVLYCMLQLMFFVLIVCVNENGRVLGFIR